MPIQAHMVCDDIETWVKCRIHGRPKTAGEPTCSPGTSHILCIATKSGSHHCRQTRQSSLELIYGCGICALLRPVNRRRSP